MLNKETYDIMKENYGKVGSWAIWGEPKATPSSNTNDMTWVDDLDLSILNTGYVFVGLNLSNTHGDKGAINNVDWANFHSGYRYQKDYKLRYALKDTEYRGSYLTDLIKDYPEVDSSKVSSYLRKNPSIVKENIESFKDEISYLGKDLKLVAMGKKTYELLNKYLGKEYQIFSIKHYSSWGGQENYQNEVLSILK